MVIKCAVVQATPQPLTMVVTVASVISTAGLPVIPSATVISTESSPVTPLAIVLPATLAKDEINPASNPVPKEATEATLSCAGTPQANKVHAEMEVGD